MWKAEHRLAAEHSGLRYPSDLTDAEWAIAGPMVPPARSGGRPRDVNVRELAEGPATEEHRASLLHAMGLGRHTGTHPSCALCGSA